MANWIYNGVELPEIPEWDKSAYPYAWLSYSDYTDELGGVFAQCSICTVQPELTGGQPSYTIPGLYSQKEYLFLSNQEIANALFEGEPLPDDMEFGAWYLTDESSGNDASIVGGNSGKAVTWANFDVLNEDGTIYLAASAPIVVGSLTPFQMGYEDGLKGLTTIRGTDPHAWTKGYVVGSLMRGKLCLSPLGTKVYNYQDFSGSGWGTYSKGEMPLTYTQFNEKTYGIPNLYLNLEEYPQVGDRVEFTVYFPRTTITGTSLIPDYITYQIHLRSGDYGNNSITGTDATYYTSNENFHVGKNVLSFDRGSLDEDSLTGGLLYEGDNVVGMRFSGIVGVALVNMWFHVYISFSSGSEWKNSTFTLEFPNDNPISMTVYKE